MVPKAEIKQRTRNLQERLKTEGLDGALFLYAIDVFYLTGSRQNSALWVPADGGPTLFVRKSYTRALRESVVRDVRPFPSSREFPVFFGENIRRIGLTFDVLPVQLYQFYSNLLGNREFVDISPINRELRSVKSAWELEQLRESGRRLAGAFGEVPGFLKPGMRELDLAAEFEYALRRAGTEGYVRIRGFNQEIAGLVSAGENAALPGCFDGPVTGKGLSSAAPYGPSEDVIAEGPPVIIDYAGIFNGYIVDMTRIFAFGGLAPELKRAFDVSLDIQAWLVANLKPGRICEELYTGAVKMAEEAGLGDKFMGYPGEQAKFVGHGVGLELDELPVLAQKFKAPLQAGQTLAVEPKFVFPGKGVVGIENTYAVTDRGGERLTDLPDRVVYL